MSQTTAVSPELAEYVETLYRDGIIGRKGAFGRDWVARLREDVGVVYAAALERPGAGRGPSRYYSELRSEQIRGFADLAVRDRAGHPVGRRVGVRARDVPPKESYPRYEARATRKLPQIGDISGRSALTIHRGTPNCSQLSRPVLVLGVDAPGAGNAEHHDIAITGPAATGRPAPATSRSHLHPAGAGRPETVPWQTAAPSSL